MSSIKIFFFMLLFSVAFACNHATNKTAEKTNSSLSNALSEYQLFVSKLDTLDVEAITTAAKKYQELFKNENLETRDKGFVVFDSCYEKMTVSMNYILYKDTTNFFAPLLENGEPISHRLRVYNDKLKRNGFRVDEEEGTPYIGQDRDFIERWFYAYVSPTMKEYLEQLDKENKEGFEEDAGVTIEPKPFVDRIIWWENFIRGNVNFIFISNANEQRKYYLTVLLAGMDNSMVYDYETNMIDNYYKTAYTYLQNSFPNSEANKIVNPFFKALLQKDTIKANDILNEYKKRSIVEKY